MTLENIVYACYEEHKKHTSKMKIQLNGVKCPTS